MADETNPPVAPLLPGKVIGTTATSPHVMREVVAPHVMRRAVGKKNVEGPIPHTASIRNPSVSSRAVAGGGAVTMVEEEEESVGLPLKHHHLQTKSTRVVIMVAAAVVVVGIADGRFLLLGKEQLAKPSPPNLWAVLSSSRKSAIATVMLNELLDRSIREGLTSNIVDLLSTLTGRVQITPPESSNPSADNSVPSAPSMSANTRMTMTDFVAVSK